MWHTLSNDECDHEWVEWSGADRCCKCGTTQS